jgi:hypothetical protein
MQHVTVYRREGRFAGWPANHGIWSWGNEIVVGFTLGYHNPAGGFHLIDRQRPEIPVQARSFDGGETWRLEEPEFRQPAFPSPSSDNSQQSTKAGLHEDIRFTHPDFALRFGRSGLRAGARSWFSVSYDRCRTWAGSFEFPDLGLPGIAARTDYLVTGPDRCLVFLTAAKADGDEGHSFCAKTVDAGESFEFVSWIGPEPAGFSIMPASVRLPDARILVALRCREGERARQTERNWLDLYASDDEGVTWTYLNRPVTQTGRGGNPAMLTRMLDGRLCLTYGYRAAPFGIRARLSSDEGKTWGQEIILRDDAGNPDIGYPRTIQRPDGAIVTVYYFNNTPEGERYIAATLWTP